jgi:outer membrane protein
MGESVLKGIRIFLLLWLGLLSGLAVSAAELKIGAVSISKILSQAPQADQANKRLQKEFEPRQKALKDTENSLRAMQQRLDKDGAVMSDSQRRNLERDLRTQTREFQRAMEEFRDDLNIRRNDELGKFQQQVLQVVNSLAKDEGFDLILNEGAVVYASQAIDITDKVLKRLSGK